MAHEQTIVLITGTSSGIGAACARHLAQRGLRVFGTRRALQQPPEGYQELAMDVTDDASVRQALDAVYEQAGRVDVLINNAGVGYAGAIEDTSITAAKAQFETNFFGALRLCQAVLPRMRERGSGRIINISSIGGLMSLPFQGMYCASKFALEAMTEALRLEVRAFGIKVSLVEPGDFRTGFTAHRVRVQPEHGSSAYADQMETTLAIAERDEQAGPDPILIAKLVEKIIRKRNPKLRYAVGMPTQRLGILLRRILSTAMFERVIAATYKI
ncbi:SDR family oxidoreductase [Haliangium sp.]|uniref:SDR family oxidoreductase n=1 Tax=Haliangium sp. TaxID=2663208 RepID=UPI003D0E5E4B